MGRPDCVCFLFCETKHSFFSKMDKNVSVEYFLPMFFPFLFIFKSEQNRLCYTDIFSYRCSSGHVISMCSRTVFIQLACNGLDKHT